MYTADLNLWKWNQPGGVEGLDLGSSSMLNPMKTIEEIFENDPPQQKYIHIVIKVPVHITGANLYMVMQQVSTKVEIYYNPSIYQKLPFMFISAVPTERFDIGEDGLFEYYG
ncbi:hypothetical protein L211DRAFT_850674 [Terfezia boudieri ATCC MYA-4762]|uniref:Uncharacterized protein n=1 Tax=Terfezia boudieri ATCC MYA-4762 TaxID=1051890 RepID=A0A3N4LWF4_9PEZI|nr:hypothetical protein L211DRAFT_850674 [Terfezia boudieri ATCC MYA-4762]